MANDLRAVLWTLGFAASGLLAGNVLDRILSRALYGKEDALAAAIQLGVGVLVLGQSMQLLIPADTQSPIGDSTLVVFFYLAQPHLLEQLMCVLDKAFHKCLPYYSKANETIVPSGSSKNVVQRTEVDGGMHPMGNCEDVALDLRTGGIRKYKC